MMIVGGGDPSSGGPYTVFFSFLNFFYKILDINFIYLPKIEVISSTILQTTPWRAFCRDHAQKPTGFPAKQPNPVPQDQNTQSQRPAENVEDKKDAEYDSEEEALRAITYDPSKFTLRTLLLVCLAHSPRPTHPTHMHAHMHTHTCTHPTSSGSSSPQMRLCRSHHLGIRLASTQRRDRWKSRKRSRPSPPRRPASARHLHWTHCATKTSAFLKCLQSFRNCFVVSSKGEVTNPGI